MQRIYMLLMLLFLLVACVPNESFQHADPVDRKDEASIPFAKFISDEEELNTEKKNKKEATKKDTLSKKEAKKQEEDPNELSYIRDRTKKYKVKHYTGKILTYEYIGQYKHGPDGTALWKAAESDGYFLTEHDNESGLYEGAPESEYWLVIPYPIEKGSFFEENEIEQIHTEITEVGLTKEVKAGRFENVIKVTNTHFNSDTYINYYAPNVGAILSINPEGETIYELLDVME